jgi:hypothetical protein
MLNMQQILEELVSIGRPRKVRDPYVDPDLQRIIEERKDLSTATYPTLQDLFRVTLDAVLHRDQDYYRDTLDINDLSENDYEILTIINSFILVAHSDGTDPGFYWG